MTYHLVKVNGQQCWAQDMRGPSLTGYERVLAFLRAYISFYGYSPEISETATNVHLCRSTVFTHLQKMRRQGLVKRAARCSRRSLVLNVNVLDARVRWNLEYGNDPQLIVLLNWEPRRFCYTRGMNSRGDVCYFAKYGGMCRYLFPETDNDGNDRSGQGFGGRVFNLGMTDGTQREVIGPWSGGAYIVNSFLDFAPVVDVLYTTDKQEFDQGRTLNSGTLTLDLAQQAVDLIDVGLVKVVHDYESVFFPRVEAYTYYPSRVEFDKLIETKVGQWTGILKGVV